MIWWFLVLWVACGVLAYGLVMGHITTKGTCFANLMDGRYDRILGHDSCASFLEDRRFALFQAVLGIAGLFGTLVHLWIEGASPRFRWIWSWEAAKREVGYPVRWEDVRS